MSRHVGKPSGPLVDVAPAQEHIRALVAKGMTAAQIAKRASLDARIVYDMLRGYRNTQGKRYMVRHCSPENLARILAVEFEPAWTPAGFSPERFKAVRESRNLSRRNLAKLVGMDEGTFQHWENGRSLPKTQANLQRALGVMGASWEDVSVPVDGGDSDEFTYSPADLDEYIPDYPCLVCGHTFRSRILLRRHPHPKRKVNT